MPLAGIASKVFVTASPFTYRQCLSNIQVQGNGIASATDCWQSPLQQVMAIAATPLPEKSAHPGQPPIGLLNSHRQPAATCSWPCHTQNATCMNCQHSAFLIMRKPTRCRCEPKMLSVVVNRISRIVSCRGQLSTQLLSIPTTAVDGGQCQYQNPNQRRPQPAN